MVSIHLHIKRRVEWIGFRQERAENGSVWEMQTHLKL
jgi:hypothetical protein